MPQTTPSARTRKVWFITGAGRGLGWHFARAALDHGDRVVATARLVEALDTLVGDAEQILRVPLDVCDAASIENAVHAAVRHFGELDVVINNAGAGERGAVEELSDAALRTAMEVNFFGTVAVTRAVLPIMRAQGRGHLISISSLGGLVGLPLAGAYIASKWALEGISESLTQEVAGLGIHVTLVEPGSFATDQGHGTAPTGTPLAAYQALRDAEQQRPERPAGDPADAAQALLRLVDLAQPPTRVILGEGIEFVEQAYASRLAGWRAAESRLRVSRTEADSDR